MSSEFKESTGLRNATERARVSTPERTVQDDRSMAAIPEALWYPSTTIQDQFRITHHVHSLARGMGYGRLPVSDVDFIFSDNGTVPEKAMPDINKSPASSVSSLLLSSLSSRRESDIYNLAFLFESELSSLGVDADRLEGICRSAGASPQFMVEWLVQVTLWPPSYRLNNPIGYAISLARAGFRASDRAIGYVGRKVKSQ